MRGFWRVWACCGKTGLRVEVAFPIAGFAEQVLDVVAHSFVEGFELNSIAPEGNVLGIWQPGVVEPQLET
ncbi:hypothetical protein E5S67_05591 [Microcoleus sp. IPMA8]|uniref:Uncharacterized protein n=1 Tax=Microcoleus asticus IPMA8 TaxID=2563858 RepID=A0ABX2D572_9CYAN|nr:hypothetical protein [Microcoleus asticus IPMA8]